MSAPPMTTGTMTRRLLPWLLPLAYCLLFAANAAMMGAAGIWSATRVAIFAGAAASALAVIAALARFLPRAWNARLSLLASTFLILALLLEVGSGWWLDRLDPHRAAQHHALAEGRPFDDRTVRQVVADLRLNGQQAYPSLARHLLLTPQFALPGPEPLALALGNPARTLLVYENELGFYPIQESDEFGFTNPLGLQRPGKVDLLFLGDSFTQGWCVNQEDSFAGLLRREWPGTVNLAMAGNGPLSNLATWREYGARLNPRLVLWCHCETNDLEDLSKEAGSGLARYRQPAFRQNLIECQPSIDKTLKQSLNDELARPESPQSITFDLLLLRKLRRCATLTHAALTAKRELGDLGLYGDVLKQARSEVEATGGKLLFIYLPDAGHFSQPDRYLAERAAVLEMAQKNSVAILDLAAEFAKADDPLAGYSFRARGHFNLLGNQRAAQAIGANVRELLTAAKENLAR